MSKRNYICLFLLALCAYPLAMMAQQDSLSTTQAATNGKGHYVRLSIGGGYSDLNYQLNNDASSLSARQIGAPSAAIELDYAFFFHRNWGISAGARFFNFTSVGQLDGTISAAATDSEGDRYTHTTAIQTFSERQTIHSLGIPVALQFKYVFTNKAGLYAAVGLAPEIALLKKYNIQNAQLTDYGYYDWAKLTLTEGHGFGNRQFADKGNIKAADINLSVNADLGASIALNSSYDLLLGAYFSYLVLDENVGDKLPIGFKTADGYSFQNDYAGMLNSELVGSSHPWMAGVKVGFQWHTPVKTKKPKRAKVIEQPIEPEPIIEEPEPEPIIEEPEPEPIIEEPEPEPIIEEPEHIIEEPLQPSVRWAKNRRFHTVSTHTVYFSFNSTELSSEARNRLKAIAQELKEHPTRVVTISGHACTLGSKQENKQVSARRAKAAEKILLTNGIDKSRITVRAYGAELPSSTAQEHDLKQDRRVVIRIIGE